jgi:hypothetical protein
MDEMDEVHVETGGELPDHCILPRAMEDEIRLEKLGEHRTFLVARERGRGLIGMQVWFSATLEERGKIALLLSDEVMAQLFDRTKDFYRGDPYYYVE